MPSIFIFVAREDSLPGLKGHSPINPDDTLQVGFYVRAGEEGYADVPQGTYNVYFAQGKTWYGTGDRFGSKTVYGKNDGVELSYGEEMQYSLTYTTNGNLHLKKLNKNDF